jgi:hypothetical protein
MRKHVTLVGAFQTGYGALLTLLALFLFVGTVGGGLLSRDRDTIVITTFVGTAIPLFLLLVSVPEIVGGVGLLRLKLWARYLVLVLAVLELLSVPFGTALGAYSLWVLVHDETAEVLAGRPG